MFAFFLIFAMSCLYAWLFTAIYWGYRKTDALLVYLPNCTTLIKRANQLRGRGILAKIHLITGIAVIVTWPRLMSRSEVVSMDDLEKFPRVEKMKLAIYTWTLAGSLTLLACLWTGSKLTEYFR